MRRRKRAGKVDLDEVGDQLVDTHDPGPERTQGSREIKSRLRQAMARLSPRQAEIFTLRYLEGLGNLEIAKLLGRLADLDRRLTAPRASPAPERAGIARRRNVMSRYKNNADLLDDAVSQMAGRADRSAQIEEAAAPRLGQAVAGHPARGLRRACPGRLRRHLGHLGCRRAGRGSRRRRPQQLRRLPVADPRLYAG